MSIVFVDLNEDDYHDPEDFENGEDDESYINEVQELEDEYPRFEADCEWCKRKLIFLQFDVGSEENYQKVRERLNKYRTMNFNVFYRSHAPRQCN
ncbi:MAG: hypothetical protein ABFS56_19375 [Pseudomonadota bacterium]